MATPSRSPIPLAAPGLSGPNTLLGGTIFRSRGRRATPQFFSRVVVEVDLQHERLAVPPADVFRRLEAFFQEQEVVGGEGVLRTTALLLHALSARGFRQVDHWEAEPGGWLPLPERTHRGPREPVGHLLRALENAQWKTVDAARSFSVRLSGSEGNRLDAVVRRVHRERSHSLTLEWRGRFRRTELVALLDAVHARLPVLRARVTHFTYV